MSDPRKTRQWQKLRLVVLARDGYSCQIRGDKCTVVATTVDHVRELNAGGDPWALSNLRAACCACNCGRFQPGRGSNLARRGRYRYRTTPAPYDTRM